MPVRYTYGNFGELLDCLLELCGHMNLDELFDAYLRCITGLISSDSCGFYVYGKDGEKVTGVGSIGVEKRFLDLYEKKGRAIDPMLARVKTERTICCSDQLMNLKEWHAHPAFEIFGPQRMDYIMDAPLYLSGHVAGTLHFSRTIRNRPFGPSEVRTVEILSRFVELGMSNALRYSDLKRDGEVFRQALHCSPEAMVIVGRGGEVRFMNRSAGEMFAGLGEGAGEDAVQSLIRTGANLLGTADGSGELEDGRKFARTEDDLGALCVEREGAGEAVTFLPVEKGGLRVGMCPLPGSADLLLAFPRKAERHLLPVWEQALSNREKDILHMAAKGMRNREIAAAAFVSVNTVKRHLDNMYAKLNVSGRTSLVAKAFGLSEEPKPV
ncbi:MAG: LuxR C-terminal-related transcriptional regulator [Desulfovibrio sp.]|nr:LuxR C-terminal-related transcriptional regulator [Desulfovibrio sp.]